MEVICSILIYFAIPVSVGLVIYMFWETPNTTTTSSTGWEHPYKRVQTYGTSYESSTDITVSNSTKTIKSRDYYNFYGIDIENKKRKIIGSPIVKITSVSVKIWDVNLNSLGEYQGRLWKRGHSGQERLFNPSNQEEKGRRELGVGEKISIVIAYNQENENEFYKFTIESDKHYSFPYEQDKLGKNKPYFVAIKIHMQRMDKLVFLRIDTKKHGKKLEIEIIKEDDFPLPKSEYK